jgi:hypothetical protein
MSGRKALFLLQDNLKGAQAYAKEQKTQHHSHRGDYGDSSNLHHAIIYDRQPQHDKGYEDNGDE